MWQPITTAQFNAPMLVTDGKIVMAAYLVNDFTGIEVEPVGVRGHIYQSRLNYNDLTHWMTLPEPPNK